MIDTPDLSIFSPALTEHLQQPPPESLYHYTGQDGLLGIIKSGSLWATNISYMNDATEFGLSLGLIRDSLSAALETSEWEIKRYAAINPKRANDAERRTQEEGRLWRIAKRTDGQDTDIYVTCFCEDGNLLSQWRGYTGGSYGYSLAFIPSELKQIASASRFILGKCIYDTDLQKRIVNETLEYFLTRGEPRKSGSKGFRCFDEIWSIL